MQNNSRKIILTGTIIILTLLGAYFWWYFKQAKSPESAQTTTPVEIETPYNSITLVASPTPELPSISLSQFFTQCGKSADLFAAHINTYTQNALNDENWVSVLTTKLDDLEMSCTNLSISDRTEIPDQVLYLKELAVKQFSEAIPLFRQGISLQETTVLLAAISKYRDATNLMIGSSYFSSSFASITPPPPDATKTTDEQNGEKAMNDFVIACSPAMEEVLSITGTYNEKSLTDTEWSKTLLGKLGTFDKACGAYDVETVPVTLQTVNFILGMGAEKCAETSLTLRDAISNKDDLEFILGTSKLNDARFLLAGAVAYGK